MYHLRQNKTFHGLYYTSCGALAGMRNSSMGPLGEMDPMTHCTMMDTLPLSYILLPMKEDSLM